MIWRDYAVGVDGPADSAFVQSGSNKEMADDPT